MWQCFRVIAILLSRIELIWRLPKKSRFGGMKPTAAQQAVVKPPSVGPGVTTGGFTCHKVKLFACFACFAGKIPIKLNLASI